MHCGPPDMVCETKIVAAEDHEALPGAKKDALLAGAMWPPLPAAPGPAAAPPPAPGPQPRGGPEGVGPPAGRGVCIREFRAAEQEAARRIFYDGILERIPNTAFRGLRQHPRTQLLYALLAALCFAVTRSLMLTCLVSAGLLALRYYYSRKVILAYLECALHTDMADIEQYYMKPPGSCFWVAVLDGNVVGIVAARAHEEDNTVELLRMSVDSRFRGKGIAKALGRKVLEFAVLHNYSAVVLGTTAVKRPFLVVRRVQAAPPALACRIERQGEPLSLRRRSWALLHEGPWVLGPGDSWDKNVRDELRPGVEQTLERTVP
ncbi:N-acetylaspartate synthetase isoform 3-T3 [Callospermophilus lateralis]|uniref:N-acetylaspartate synthetase isoform X3 n=1 Tax=Callospermophilus lateralis TaxID=76772 RepID=UPI004038B3E9